MTKGEMAMELYIYYANCGYTYSDFMALTKEVVKLNYNRMKKEKNEPRFYKN